MEVRRALHAGSWYPRFKPDLLRNLEEYFNDNKFGPGEEPKTLNKDTRTIIGGVSPHAGYQYSARCAAFTYLNLFKERIPDTVVILGNDHHGYGNIALMKEGEWETPLGNLKIDSELCEKILDISNTIIQDNSAFVGFPFENEHNIEIQLPFIKYCAKDHDVKIVPIKIGSRFIKDYEICEKISTDIANAIKSMNKDIVIVASSDMTHRGLKNADDDLKKFMRKDQDVIDAFIELNPKKVFNATSGTICGLHTIVTLMHSCIKLNASKAECLQYYTSYEISKSLDYCVAYFSGILIK